MADENENLLRDLNIAMDAAFDLLRVIYRQPHGLLFVGDEPAQQSRIYQSALATVQRLQTTYKGKTLARDWTPDTPHSRVHDRRQCLAQGIRAYLFKRDGEARDREIVEGTFWQYFAESVMVETLSAEPLPEESELRELLAESVSWSAANRQTAFVIARAVFDLYRERQWLETPAESK